MSRLVRFVSIGFLALVILACTGGGGENKLLGANYFVPSSIGTVVAVFAGAATVDVAGEQIVAKLPTGVTVTPGTPVMLIRSDGMFADRAYLPSGSPSVKVTNLTTTLGGDIAGLGLTQGNAQIRTSGNLAIPEGRWRLEYNGPVRFFAQSKSAGMDVQQLLFEFDVFADGFTNLPIEVYGDLPRNGKSQAGLNLSGKIPPNNGVGPAFLDLTGVGGVTKTYQVVKQQGAETWTWISKDTITVPADGWQTIGVRVGF